MKITGDYIFSEETIFKGWVNIKDETSSNERKPCTILLKEV